jgi:hypothetical protein
LKLEPLPIQLILQRLQLLIPRYRRWLTQSELIELLLLFVQPKLQGSQLLRRGPGRLPKGGCWKQDSEHGQNGLH